MFLYWAIYNILLKSLKANVLAFNLQENNQEGTWVQLDSESKKEFCFNTDGEAWSLSVSRGDVVYLQHDSNRGSLMFKFFVSPHSIFSMQTRGMRG